MGQKQRLGVQARMAGPPVDQQLPVAAHMMPLACVSMCGGICTTSCLGQALNARDVLLIVLLGLTPGLPARMQGIQPPELCFGQAAAATRISLFACLSYGGSPCCIVAGAACRFGSSSANGRMVFVVTSVVFRSSSFLALWLNRVYGLVAHSTWLSVEAGKPGPTACLI